MGRVTNLKDVAESNDKAILSLVDRFAQRCKSIERATKTELKPDPLSIAQNIKARPKNFIKFIDLKNEEFKNLDKLQIKGGTPSFKTMFKKSLEAYIKSLLTQKQNGKTVDMNLLLKPFLKMEASAKTKR